MGWGEASGMTHHEALVIHLLAFLVLELGLVVGLLAGFATRLHLLDRIKKGKAESDGAE